MTDRDANGKFIKGKSGNPGGRPKLETPLSDLIDACITEEDWLTAFTKLKTKFLNGDMRVIELFLDRRFGRPMQQTQLTGENGGAVKVEYVNTPYPITYIPPKAS